MAALAIKSAISAGSCQLLRGMRDANSGSETVIPVHGIEFKD